MFHNDCILIQNLLFFLAICLLLKYNKSLHFYINVLFLITIPRIPYYKIVASFKTIMLDFVIIVSDK
jgi:hypothetical protein